MRLLIVLACLASVNAAVDSPQPPAGGGDVSTWADVLEAVVDEHIVTDSALREAIRRSGLPWRVRDRATGIEMVLVPAGQFVMGRSEGDVQAEPDEGPPRTVMLSSPFYMGRYEVTQEQYFRTCHPASAAARDVAGTGSADDVRGRQWPAETLTWSDCANFCRISGLRLPTEAEWEFACRAGDRTARYGPIGEIAWCAENSDAETHPVGLKRANALGLHDMIGNVWEWVADWYGPYSGAPQQDPSGPTRGESRVLRGGSRGSLAELCRASYRNAGDPSVTLNGDGFRVARTP
ncbi:MAG: formylglycine-generating enzyme family protein [Phycisphaerales bacterium]|nr:formylglycine-generating enzyme family protein [Phycisphaerales bacterium]